MIKRKETISVFMDGEASEFESASVLKSIKQEPLLERCWEGYHTIGDAMRNQVSASLNSSFSRRLSRALDQEINPFSSGTETPRKHGYNGTAGFALAASVSAVAMVGLLQFGQPTMLTTANNEYETDIQKQHLAMAENSPAMAVDTAMPIKMDNQALAYASFDSTDFNKPTDTAMANDLESSVYGYLVNYSQYAVSTPLEGSAPNVSLVSYRMD
jgi:sigma-E factor negative regulatory protein RseA